LKWRRYGGQERRKHDEKEATQEVAVRITAMRTLMSASALRHGGISLCGDDNE
jgi:hypothetical protein